MNVDQQTEICEQVRAAAAASESLAIIGGGTRGRQCTPVRGRPLKLAGHAGIVDYQPSELVLTARAGTRLVELEHALAETGQMLPFEPPRFGDAATLGGAVALGASGPRRPWTGAVRDFVLGVRVINGRGELLRFGGQVMKNVAGYDAARLMVGARGTLGVLTEVSLKVLPRPESERTFCLQLDGYCALRKFIEWGRTSLPLSAAAWESDGGSLKVRLSGAERAVQAAARRVGGEEDTAGEAYWQSVRDLQHPLLQADAPQLWRLVVPPAAPLPETPHNAILLDWGGAQRWLQSGFDAEYVHAMAAKNGGHAAPVRGGVPSLPSVQRELHRRLKQAFDPAGVFNPGAFGVI